MIATAAERIDRWRAAAARATLLPALVRVGVLLCGAFGIVVAFPVAFVTGQMFVLLLAAAALPAFAPRGWAGTFVAVLVVAGWILDTAWYSTPVTLGRLLALAAVLYLGHSLTALAAVLPYDAVVRTDVLAHWFARALAVVLASAVLIIGVLSLADRVGGGDHTVATFAGLATAVVAAALLTRLLRRR